MDSVDDHIVTMKKMCARSIELTIAWLPMLMKTEIIFMNEYFYETSTQYTFQTTTLSIRMKVVYKEIQVYL